MNEKTVTTKALVVGLMNAWCTEGGIASDLNNHWTYSPSEEHDDFEFTDKDGKVNINVVSELMFTFLSELEEVIGQPDYISFEHDSCWIKKDGLWVIVSRKYGR